jgi:hypothetical protein
MKNLKLLGLAVVAVTALMAFAASPASATELYSGATPLGVGSGLDFSIPAGGSVLLVDTENEPINTCITSTIRSNLTGTATGELSEFTWKKCTYTTSTLTLGKLEVISTGSTNGIVRADATIEVTINTPIFGSCIYGITANANIGTLAFSPATFTVNAVVEKFSGSNLACSATGKLTGTYYSTEPGQFHVEEN